MLSMLGGIKLTRVPYVNLAPLLTDLDRLMNYNELITDKTVISYAYMNAWFLFYVTRKVTLYRNIVKTFISFGGMKS